MKWLRALRLRLRAGSGIARKNPDDHREGWMDCAMRMVEIADADDKDYLTARWVFIHRVLGETKREALGIAARLRSIRPDRIEFEHMAEHWDDEDYDGPTVDEMRRCLPHVTPGLMRAIPAAEGRSPDHKPQSPPSPDSVEPGRGGDLRRAEGELLCLLAAACAHLMHPQREDYREGLERNVRSANDYFAATRAEASSEATGTPPAKRSEAAKPEIPAQENSQ